MNKKHVVIVLLILSTVSGLAAWFGDAWISVPFGISYSILIPGVLMMLSLRRNLDFSWTSLVYIVGLGISFLMFAGLGINSIGREVGITRPFSQSVLTGGIAVATILLFVAFKRWDEQPIEFVHMHLSKEQKTVIILSTLILLCFIAGALSLNNGAQGTISLISFLLTPILFIYTLVRSKHLKSGVIIFTLWMLGLGILLSGSLRSLYVSGPDISLEYSISQLVKSNGYWSIDTFRNGYNACLSIGILAPILSILTKLSVALVYKLLVPIIYTLIVPVVYLIARSFISVRGSLITAFFFISQPVFVVWWWIPERQQVAFLLFSLLILMLVGKEFKARSKYLMFLALTAGLIVSHYSTALLAISYFIISFFTKLIIGCRYDPVPSGFKIITPRILLIMIIGYFSWYSQITYGFNGIIDYTSKSFSNISRLFSADNQVGGQNLVSQFNIFANPGQTTITFNDYVISANKSSVSRFGNTGTYKSNADIVLQTSYGQTNSRLLTAFTYIRKFVILLGKLAIIVGVYVMGFLAWNSVKRKRYIITALPALFLLGATIILPFFSIAYDQVRTFQQMLICTGGVYGLIFILPKKFLVKGIYTLGVFVIMYFILVSGTWAYFTDSHTVPAGLSDRSYDSVFYYEHDSDLAAGRWLIHSAVEESVIVADNFAVNKLRLVFTPNQSSAISQSLVPTAIPKESFVVVTKTNNITGDAFASVNNTLITYTFPFSFLGDNKNLVYNNNGDVIYR